METFSLFNDFLKNLETVTGNHSLIESIRAGYKACFEGHDYENRDHYDHGALADTASAYQDEIFDKYADRYKEADNEDDASKIQDDYKHFKNVSNEYINAKTDKINNENHVSTEIYKSYMDSHINSILQYIRSRLPRGFHVNVTHQLEGEMNFKFDIVSIVPPSTVATIYLKREPGQMMKSGSTLYDVRMYYTLSEYDADMHGPADLDEIMDSIIDVIEKRP